jgi:hypothetical protein
MPLQTPGAAARLGVSELAFEIRMHLLMADGRVFNNADAFGVLCRTVWWLWPVGALLLIPGFRELGRLIYDWFARNRYRFGGACEIGPNSGNAPGWKHVSRTADHKQMRLSAVPLLLLPTLVLIFGRHWDAWVFMWALAFALFAGCKWLTCSMALERSIRNRRWRVPGYLFAWPGMDADTFLMSDNRVAKPKLTECMFAITNTLFGMVLLWNITWHIPVIHPLVAGWIGMIGVVLMLHFGLFHLLSLAWRAAGVSATPLMQSPLRAVSLAEFWGKRWNTAFHELVHRFTFRPMARRVGATRAMLCVFLLSGLVHDLVISLPARGGYGLPTGYFMIQGLGVAAEHTHVGRRIGLGHGWRGWLFTMIVATAPAFWLFHPRFIFNVILPMLHAIGAT